MIQAKTVLKIPVANVFRLITPQTHPGHGRCMKARNQGRRKPLEKCVGHNLKLYWTMDIV